MPLPSRPLRPLPMPPQSMPNAAPTPRPGPLMGGPLPQRGTVTTKPSLGGFGASNPVQKLGFRPGTGAGPGIPQLPGAPGAGPYKAQGLTPNVPAPTPGGTPIPGKNMLPPTNPQNLVGGTLGGVLPKFGPGANGPRGTAGGATPPVGTEAPPPPQSAADKLYQDLLGQDAADWEKQQKGLTDQAQGFMRAADVQNARMGRNAAGGGYASMAGAALGKGMQVYEDAMLQHGDRRRQLQLAWLDKSIAETNRAADIAWREKVWNTEREDMLAGKAEDRETESFQAAMDSMANGELTFAQVQSMFPDKMKDAQGNAMNTNTTGMAEDAPYNDVDFGKAYSSADMTKLAKSVGFGSWFSMSDEMRDEVMKYATAVHEDKGRWPSPGELRDRLRDVGLYEG